MTRWHWALVCFMFGVLGWGVGDVREQNKDILETLKRIENSKG